MRTTWTFHTAGQLVFGAGAVGQLGELVRRRRLGRAFVVTDKRLAAARIVERVVAPLSAAQIAVQVFDGGEGWAAVLS